MANTKNTQPKVTKQNKKDDIWDAYIELLDEVSSESTTDQSFVEQKDEEVRLDKSVKSYSLDNLNKEAKKLLILFEESLSKLEDITSAISLKQKKLQDLHKIEAEAVSLKAFVLKVEEEKKKWQEKQAETEKLRHREEEEYAYNLRRKREMDDEEYKSKKREQEKLFNEKIAEREEALTLAKREFEAQLQEFEELKKLRDSYEAVKAKEISSAIAKQESDLRKEFDIENRLRDQDHVNEVAMLKQEISVLKTNLDEKDKRLNESLIEARKANEKAQQLAIKVIEVKGSGAVSTSNNKGE